MKLKNRLIVYISRLHRNQQGTVMILMALVMVALLGFVALVTDVGLLYAQKARLSNAADAAALAGAQELPGNTDAARDVTHPARREAIKYANANGVQTSELEVSFSGDDSTTITVDVYRSVPMLFARILGIDSRDVHATASAAVGSIAGVKGVVPFSIVEEQTPLPLNYEQEYVLKRGSGGSSLNDGTRKMNGWFGALDFGKDTYTNYIANGDPVMLSVGGTVYRENGNMSNPTTAGVKARICPHIPPCTFENFKRGCPRVAIIPVIKDDGSGKWIVTSFAAFFLEPPPGNGIDNNVYGYFVRTIYPGEQQAGSNYGVSAVKLTH